MKNILYFSLAFLSLILTGYFIDQHNANVRDCKNIQIEVIEKPGYDILPFERKTCASVGINI